MLYYGREHIIIMNPLPLIKPLEINLPLNLPWSIPRISSFFLKSIYNWSIFAPTSLLFNLHVWLSCCVFISSFILFNHSFFSLLGKANLKQLGSSSKIPHWLPQEKIQLNLQIHTFLVVWWLSLSFLVLHFNHHQLGAL